MIRSLPFLLFIFLLGCKEATRKDTDMVKSEAPVLELTENDLALPVYDFAGLEPMLHRKDNKTYIINFWATWCAPCVKELPYFEKINAEYKDDNVEVVLVSLDMPKMWESHLYPFVKKKKLQSKVVILDDPKMNVWIPKVDEDWGGGIPATLIYNRDKRTFFERGLTYGELQQELEKFKNQ